MENKINEIVELAKAVARLKALLDSLEMTPKELDAEISRLSEAIQAEVCPNV